jgi:glycosyltransferase involved in cell wall biosynthesis
VPVRNGERYLRQALDSILTQSFSDLEVVISDNASTDSTAAICEEYATRDRRVRYERRPADIGPAENFNVVFRQSRGEYFKWAAADDICGPDFLRRAVEVLDTDVETVVCYARTAIIDDAGQVVRAEDYEVPLEAEAPAERLRALVRVDHRRHGAHELYGVMRSEALRRTDLHSPHVRSDSIALVQLCLQGKLVTLPDVLFFNRDHSGRSTSGKERPIRPGSRLSRWIGGGPKPPTDWFNPAKRGRIVFPEWDVVAQYTSAVHTADLPEADRLACYRVMAASCVALAPKLARDLLIAAEQATRLASRGRAPWRGGLEELA